MQRTAGLRAFDQNDCPREGDLQAVACREMTGADPAAGCLFADQQTALGHLPLQLGVMAGVDAIEAGAEYGNRAPTGTQTAPMGRRVDAVSQAADHRPARPGQGSTNGLSHGQPMNRGVTRAHHGHRLSPPQR